VYKTTPEFPSDEWILDIKNLCYRFQKRLAKTSGGQYLVFRDDIGTKEKPGRIVKEYHKNVDLLKEKIPIRAGCILFFLR